jgi:hypothetical protein
VRREDIRYLFGVVEPELEVVEAEAVVGGAGGGIFHASTRIFQSDPSWPMTLNQSPTRHALTERRR